MTLEATTSTPSAGPAPCRECPRNLCMWRVPATRSYLYAAQAARQFRISLAEAIRDKLKSSREDAGVVRRTRTDPQGALDIAIVLEQIRDAHGLALVPWNAERIAAIACPDRCHEVSPIDR